ncbi:MAG: enoyl-CoA hydratase/isomerase family protein [Deltaproteobacteria bacterium]|nr:enoyl-CoA hydratase/isomerase family protein [Deltaproteobacteria bacterium]
MRVPLPWQARLLARKVGTLVEEAIPRTAPASFEFRGEALSTTLEGETLLVTLHREPCNEIGTTALAELEIVARLLSRPGDRVRAAIFHSSVSRGFCAGADLAELHGGLMSRAGEGASRLRVAAEARDFIDRIHAAFDAIDMAPVTTIGALHGFCFGGGFELALCCDVLVAEKSTRFAFPELRLGLVPGFGGIPRLKRDVGNAVIRDILFTGRSINAKKAQDVGLVSQVVARGRGLEVAKKVAEQAARFDAATTAAAKRFTKPLPREELARERDLFIEMLGSDVVSAALRKFVEDDSVRPYLP